MKVFDLTKFSEVIVYVGGNDASDGTETESFEEIYEQMPCYIKKINRECQIILCNTCPRGDTSTPEVTEIIQRLSEHHNAGFIDLSSAFHDRHGDIIDRYYARDCIHLSPSGVKRLLGEMNKEITIVNDFEKCIYAKRFPNRSQCNQSHADSWKNKHNRQTGSNRYQVEGGKFCKNVEKVITKQTDASIKNN